MSILYGLKFCGWLNFPRKGNFQDKHFVDRLPSLHIHSYIHALYLIFKDKIISVSASKTTKQELFLTKF